MNAFYQDAALREVAKIQLEKAMQERGKRAASHPQFIKPPCSPLPNLQLGLWFAGDEAFDETVRSGLWSVNFRVFASVLETLVPGEI